ncbi:hypothetical protein RDE2_39950 [Rhodococcus sp. RDE2]|nr:hypothetical protein RDE2_39950 [Rhodococcus sp. RDE2]
MWPNCFCEKFNSFTTTGHFAVTTRPSHRPDRCIQAKADEQTYEIEPIDVMTFDDEGRITSMRAVWAPSDMRVR